MSHVVPTTTWEATAIFSLIGAYTTEIVASVNSAILSFTKDNKRQFMSFSFIYKQ
jgi:hypothetical protein